VVATAFHALYPKPESRTLQHGNFRTPGEFSALVFLTKELSAATGSLSDRREAG